MCPDRQLISLYVDGELPSPWKEKLEAHLDLCGSCARAAEVYRSISADLAAAPVEGLEAARSRVWSAVSKKAGVEPVPFRRRRALVLPVPAAVAAMLVVALAAAGSTGVALRSNKGKTEAIAAAENSHAPAAIPVSDMGSVLRYLEKQDSGGDILIIRLPESSNFSYEGQPTLIKAADYNGRPLP